MPQPTNDQNQQAAGQGDTTAQPAAQNQQSAAQNQQPAAQPPVKTEPALPEPIAQEPDKKTAQEPKVQQSRTIADVLFSEDLISKEHLDQIKFSAAREKKSIEQVIKDTGAVGDDQLVKAKSMVYGIPYVDLKETVVAKEASEMIDEETAKSNRAIPFSVSPEGVKVAMVDPLDIQAVRYLEQKLKARVLPYSTTEAQFQETVSKVYGEMVGEKVGEAVSEALEEVKGIVEIEETGKDASLEDLSKAGVAKVVNMILESAVADKASDIHIEPQEDKIRVRFRVNGIMLEKLQLPIKMGPALVSRIKILSQLKIDVKRKPQDGRFFVRVGQEEVDLRVSTLPTVYGEKVVIRLLKRGGGILEIEKTGLRGTGLKIYLDAITATSGIVLVTGPTGSGKTVTLASSVARINTPKVNIVTLEDPVEIKVEGVNQVQVNADAGLTFANGLRSILRQDPDIVMVGEIRDEETARLATKAALTGHLVFSTLHTNSAAGALPRLLDMNIESYLIASTVRISVGQRLVRTLCQNCREEVAVNEELAGKIKMVLSGIQDFNIDEFIRRNGGLKLYKSKGCSECDNTGYSGRTGIFEVLKISDQIGQMIMQHQPATEIEAQSKKEGMISMIQDGYMKALEGITTLDEVLRVTKV